MELEMSKPQTRTSPAISATGADAASQSESSSEDEGVGGGDSLESDGSGPDSSEHANGEDNEWSEDSESSGASGSSEAKPGSEQILFPAALPATSVRLMAQSVGCTISDHVAAALGHLAMNKLRRVVMIADQLRKHDQSLGLSVDHFSVAERLMGSESFGYKGTSTFPEFKHVGNGVSVLEDTRQIDLVATTSHSRDNPTPLLTMSTLSLSHHQLPTATTLPHIAIAASDSDHEYSMRRRKPQIPDTQLDDYCHPAETVSGVDGVMDYPDTSDTDSLYYVSEDEHNAQPHVEGQRNRKLRQRSEVLKMTSRMSSISTVQPSTAKVASQLEKLVEKVLVLNEEREALEGSEGAAKFQCGVVVGIEWIDYMKVFVAAFFQRDRDEMEGKLENAEKEPVVSESQNGDIQQTGVPVTSKKAKRSHLSSSADFKLIIEDITANGIQPVLGVVLNFFTDYMDQKFGPCDVEGCRRILSVMESSLKCSVKTDIFYFHKIWKTLIKLLSLPPAYELHQKFVQVFILLIKNGSKEFSVTVALWTSEYITDALNSALTSCFHVFNSNLITLNLSLSLAIALEGVGITLFMDLDWHSHVLDFLQATNSIGSHSSTQNDNLNNSELMETDEITESVQPKYSFPMFKLTAQLQETLLLFFRVLIKNYGDSLTGDEILRIHEILLDSFGERVVPYLAETLPEPILSTAKKHKGMKTDAKLARSIRSTQWKNTRIMIGKMPGLK